MPEAGFFAQKRNSPGGLALVILLHAAVLAALIMIRSPQFIRPPQGPITFRNIPVDPDPPPEPRQPQRPQAQQPQPELDSFRPIVPTTPLGPTVITTLPPPVIPGPEILPPPVIHPDPPPPPVRRAAELDPRFSGELQPPYPAAEQRAQHEGTVRVRVTIGPDGRVKAVSRLQATSDAFWAVTERQALSRWRFRPATVDGRPVEDSKVMTLQFRLIDLG